MYFWNPETYQILSCYFNRCVELLTIHILIYLFQKILNAMIYFAEIRLKNMRKIYWFCHWIFTSYFVFCFFFKFLERVEFLSFYLGNGFISPETYSHACYFLKKFKFLSYYLICLCNVEYLLLKLCRIP